MAKEVVESVVGVKETLGKLVVEGLEAGKTNIIKAADFVKEQAPELVREILAWNLVRSILLLVIGWTAFIWMLRWCIKDIKRYNDDEENLIQTSDGMIIVLWVIVGVVGFVMGTIHVFEALKIIFAPRLYLLEYIKTLLATNG